MFHINVLHLSFTSNCYFHIVNECPFEHNNIVLPLIIEEYTLSIILFNNPSLLFTIDHCSSIFSNFYSPKMVSTLIKLNNGLHIVSSQLHKVISFVKCPFSLHIWLLLKDSKVGKHFQSICHFNLKPFIKDLSKIYYVSCQLYL